MSTYCQSVFEAEECVPAPAQGYIALQALKSLAIPQECYQLVASEHIFKATFYLEFIKLLNFSCQIPLGVWLKDAVNGYDLLVSCGSKDLKTEKRWQQHFLPEDKETVLHKMVERVQSWYKQS